MSEENRWHEERLAALLGLLKPAPVGWIEAAAELPRLRLVLDELIARAEVDAEVRAALVADLEAALEQEGIEPTPRIVAELRRRLEG